MKYVKNGSAKAVKSLGLFIFSLVIPTIITLVVLSFCYNIVSVLVTLTISLDSWILATCLTIVPGFIFVFLNAEYRSGTRIWIFNLLFITVYADLAAFYAPSEWNGWITGLFSIILFFSFDSIENWVKNLEDRIILRKQFEEWGEKYKHTIPVERKIAG